MRKIYLLFSALLISALSFGQTVEIMHETFGTGGFWEGAMNTNPNVVSPAVFSDDLMRFQNWNASKGYDKASGGFHGIMTDAVPTDTLKFYVNTNGFDNIQYSMGIFSWGAPYGQFAFEYSTDELTWTPFDKDNLASGDLSKAGWQFITFSELLPAADQLWIKVYRTAAQVHFDDLVLTGDVNQANAFLDSIGLDIGDIDFSYFTYNYGVNLPYGTTDVPVITATAFDNDAVVEVTNATDVTSAVEADRTSGIKVTSANGLVENTYNIVFTVEPPRTDAGLEMIELGYAALAPDFEPEVYRYLVDLPDTATVIPEITPVLSDIEGATYEITPPADLSSADVADRTATIVVTAQDGTTQQTYEVVFKVGGGSTDLFLMDYETFGNEGNKFDIILNTYGGFTSDFIWGDQNVIIRTSNPSTGYELASGGNRVEVQAGWGIGDDTLVFQANTSQFGNVTLATGIYNNSGADIGASTAFRAYYSTDSVNWTSMGNETAPQSAAFPVSNAWSYVILDDVLPTDDTLYIMFANEDPNFEYYLDDISLWGTPLNTNNLLIDIELSEGTLDPAFDPEVTSYVVDLPQGTSATPAVTPEKLATSATIEQTDAVDVRSLDEADRTTTIVVTAENGAVRTYEILFNVYMSSNANLDTITVGNLPLAPQFSNDIYGYAVKLPAGTTEAPAINAVAEDEFAEVTVTPPADITSSDIADRTAYVDVVAEDQLNSKTFQIVFTFGSFEDVRFNVVQEMFSVTGNYEAEDYPGYTSDADFDGDEHKWDNANSDSYSLASGGAAIKFGEWTGEPTYVELVMEKEIMGYTNIMLSFGIEHNSNGWGDNGCGLTNNFIQVEYTLDSINWVALNMDSLTTGSSDWPCGGAPFNFIEMAEEIPMDADNHITIRFTHTEATIHPFYIDDIVLSGTPVSTDASVTDMTVEGGDLDPLFDPYVYDYTVDLPIGTTETPAVTVIPSDENATYVVEDAADVTSDNEADRTTTVTVTAADGVTTLEYYIVYNVLPNNDATLSDLSAAVGTLDPQFDPLTFDYAVELPVGSTEIPDVTAVPNDPNATVDIAAGTDITSDNEADRTTTIVVTAEDGENTLTYSIVFTRDNTGINNLSVNTLSIYPNPVAERLYISNAEEIATVKVSSVIGNVVDIHSEDFAGRKSIDVSGLHSGLYIISVTTNKGEILTARFVKE